MGIAKMFAIIKLRSFNIKFVPTLMGLLMLVAATAGFWLKPTIKLSDLQSREPLKTLVPEEFGGWRSVSTDGMVLKDPNMTKNLQRIYTETISRTYIDSKGRRVMVSIAYGENQRDSMSMHYPEVCYPAQGFEERSAYNGQIISPYGAIQVKRLEMKLGARNELITYWGMLGDHQSLGGINKKLNEIRYSLKDIIPDGLLFRVSSIGNNAEMAYREHEEFVLSMLGSISQEARKRLVGL